MSPVLQEIDHPVEDVVWKVESRELFCKCVMPDGVESLRKIERDESGRGLGTEDGGNML